MLQHDILLEKKLNFSSKTTRQNEKNVYTTPPPPNFLQSTGYLRCRLPISKKAYLKEQTEKLFSKIIPDRKPEVLNNNKLVQQIKTTNLQLINIQGGISLTAMDGGGSKLPRVLDASLKL
ncbi:hypothetical protein KP612_10150 [Treponema denticola]|uniref:hypothetical protein n=1 Tax=Treponema denticola TaxID=158 RepID=UPI0011C87FB3|nr:hypothetical protein [Treponema denticola]UTD06613.1 hypothetical protein E4N90_01140 [Treponema denticola]